MNRSRMFVALGVPLLVLACSSGSGGGYGVTTQGSSGGETVQPHCYLSRNDLTCECRANDDDENHLAADWKKVAKCDASTVGAPITCTADTKVDGDTTQCNCRAWRCAVSGGRCSCGENPSGDPVSSCKEDEWYCGRNDKSFCYGGNGAFGSGCANEEASVTSCSMTGLKRAEDDSADCNSLRFVVPPPSPPSSFSSGSSGCNGCHSDSDCHDKCKRCERSTCSCVSRTTC